MRTFSDIGLNGEIIDALTALGFEEPTPVQAQVIPLLLEQEVDIVSLAQTGTGKTAAFGLPLIQLADPHNRQTQGLVLCPTRELCMQVASDLTSFSRFLEGIKVLAVYGGARIDQQIRALRSGVQIIVATPGRLKDLITRGAVDISTVRYVVFDEADEMLQMGFQEELNAILAVTPKEKNTLLFSATMSKEVTKIAGRYMSDPVEVTVGQLNAGAENVAHEYYLVNSRDRYPALKRILDNCPEIYSIIFCRTKMDTQAIADKLTQDGYRADALHGDLSQAQRDAVMKKFRSGQSRLLVATDVAARGLDVNDLTHVINYSLPDDTAAYTHRSGRTGRAGRSGTSAALVDRRELYKLRQIENRIRKKFRHCPVPSGQDICRNHLAVLIDRVKGVTVNHEQIDPLYVELAAELEHLDREQLLRRFLSLESNRLLEYYQDAPDLNPPPLKGKQQEKKDRGRKKPQPRRAEQRCTDNGKEFTRFHLNVGRRSGILPENLISTINGVPGGGKIRIGKIEIMRNTATLEGDSRFIPQIMHAFQQAEINGRAVSIKVVPGRNADAAGRNGRRRSGYRDRRVKKG
ncbi:MAG: DEAD/DEAH box helicase [Candidatus Electrothrix sp. YB6]